MANIINFAKANEMKFLAVHTYYTEEGKKDAKGRITNWHLKSAKESIKRYEKNPFLVDYETAEMVHYNQVYIRGCTEYITIDTDEPEQYEYIKLWAQENGIYEESAITESYSNREKGLKYKNHFWFKIDDPETFADNIKIGCVQYNGIDTFYGDACQISEWIDATISDVPLITTKIYKALISNIENKFPKDAKPKDAKPKTAKPKSESDNDDSENILMSFIPSVDVEENKYCELVALLSVRRAIELNSWLSVITLLKGIDKDYINIADQFSRQCKSKYPGYKQIAAQWKSAKPCARKKSIAILRAQAKEDAPQGYRDWMKKYPTDIIEDKAYEKMKEEIEANDGLFFNEATSSFCWKNRHGELEYKSEKELKLTLANKLIDDKPFYDTWIRDELRATKTKVGFMPNTTLADVYNTFTGFKYNNDKPENNEIIKPFLELADELMGGDSKCFWDWAAWIRQRPERKTGKFIFLYSDIQGVGKNTFIELLSEVIGYTTNFDGLKDLTDNFNSHFCDKLILYGDEITAKAREMRDDLKRIVTRPTLIKKAKYQNAIQVADYGNIIMTSNNKTAVSAEASCRRAILIELMNKIMTAETAKILYGLLKNIEFLEAFDTFLKKRDIPDALEVIDNNFRKSLINFSAPAYIQMIYRDPSAYVGKIFKSNELYAKAVTYAQTHRMESTFSPDKMSKDFKKEFAPYFKHNVGYRFFLKTDMSSEDQLKNFMLHLKTHRPELLGLEHNETDEERQIRINTKETIRKIKIATFTTEAEKDKFELDELMKKMKADKEALELLQSKINKDVELKTKITLKLKANK